MVFNFLVAIATGVTKKLFDGHKLLFIKIQSKKGTLNEFKPQLRLELPISSIKNRIFYNFNEIYKPKQSFFGFALVFLVEFSAERHYK